MNTFKPLPPQQVARVRAATVHWLREQGGTIREVAQALRFTPEEVRRYEAKFHRLKLPYGVLKARIAALRIGDRIPFRDHNERTKLHGTARDMQIKLATRHGQLERIE